MVAYSLIAGPCSGTIAMTEAVALSPAGQATIKAVSTSAASTIPVIQVVIVIVVVAVIAFLAYKAYKTGFFSRWF